MLANSVTRREAVLFVLNSLLLRAEPQVPEAVAQFPTAFDRSSNRYRMVVLVSPTCGVCLDGASAISQLLQEMPDADLDVFVVWERVLRSDHGGPRPEAVSRVLDRRARHFWDPEKIISQQFGGPEGFLRRPDTRVLFDLKKTVWDVAIVYPPGETWRNGNAAMIFGGGQIERVVNDAKRALIDARVSRPLPRVSGILEPYRGSSAHRG